MASKKKTEKIEKPEIIEEITPEVAPEEAKIEEVKSEQPEIQPENVSESKKSKKEDKKVAEKEPKYKIGSIVFVSREAEADLNGFKLFPQYKKYTYTVEAYDAISDVYTLRRLNLSLRLKEAFILAPEEKAHDSLNRRQF
jgi:hypothetical protein